jgi:hypothetical protein
VARKTDDRGVRRLRDFQLVALQLGELRAPCRIVAVGGEEAVLEPQDPEAFARAALPARATLSFETAQHPVLLLGMAGEGPVAGTVAFWVTDAVSRRELRLRPRLNAEFDVRLRPLDRSAPPESRKTVDLSAGGTLVRGYQAAAGTLVEAQIAVPALPRPVACTAEVVRRLPVGAALEFRDLDAGVARTLDRFIFGVRQQVARRAFRQAA